MADPDEVEQHLREVERELHDAAAGVLGRHGLMLTKWMFIAELLDGDGTRMLESFVSPDMRAWDTLGMMAFLDARERGVVGAEAAAQFGDE